MATKFERLMGNVLCKKRRNDSPMNPVDRVIGRCAQICPPSIRKKKPFWDKQVFETSPPPLNQQPKMSNNEKEQRQNGWESATLQVPDATDSNPPIAPPRKKRSSMSPKNEAPRKLEHLLDRSQTEDEGVDTPTSSEVEPSTPPITQKIEVIKKPPSPTKVVPHIGNKKSDKFFGESIADSLGQEEKSPEPEELAPVETNSNKDADKTWTASEDEVDAEIKCRIETPEMTEEIIRQINKETGNLIFALERETRKPCTEYQGQKSVEEEVIVPVKRKPRHICDDTDALHKILHCPDPKAPKKPQRDFAKYKKSLDSNKSPEKNDSNLERFPKKEHSEKKVNNCEPPIGSTTKNTEVLVHSEEDENKSPTKLHEETFSEAETIPADEEPVQTPPPIPPKLKHIKKTSLASTTSEPSEKPESVSPNMSNSEKILRRCLSTQSYLTPDLVDKIAQQANSLSLSTLYLPEDYSGLSKDDGSGSVSPNYKLTEKRRGISPQVSRVDQDDLKTRENDNEKPIVESEHEKTVEVKEKVSEKPTTESQHEETIEVREHTPATVIKEVKSEKQGPQLKLLITSENNESSNHSVSRLNSEEGRKIKRNVSVTPSTPEEISETIQTFLQKEDLSPKNVLKLLEDEFGDVIHSKNLSSEDKAIIEQLRKSAEVQFEPTETVQTTLNSNHSETGEIKIEQPELNKKANKSHHHSKIPKLINKELEGVTLAEKRRHSIDELDSWFSPKSKGVKVKRRRETSLPNCLDSSDSTNLEVDIDVAKSEQIQAEPVSIGDEVHIESEMSNPPVITIKKSKTNKKLETNNEHSSLLKFLEMEKNSHYA